MAPKSDPGKVVELTLRVSGGEVGNPSALAPKVGPLGLPPKKVAEDIAKATKDYKGLRVTVKLIIQNRQAQVEVVPTASTLIIKALNEPYQPNKKGIQHNGNLTLEDVINVAKVIRPKSYAKTFAGTVKEILGTCVSVGCTVEGKSPKQVISEINEGTITIEEP